MGRPEGQLKESKGLQEGSEGLPEGYEGQPKRPKGQTGGWRYGGNFSPFYRTSSPVGNPAQKGLVMGWVTFLNKV